MLKKVRREFYLLPRGEQRAMIILSFLLVASLGFRITVQMLPGRQPEGLDQFVEESRQILAAMAEADSLEEARQDSLYRARRDSLASVRKKAYHTSYAGNSSDGKPSCRSPST